MGGAMLLGGRRCWAGDAWARLSLGPPRGLQSSLLVSHSFIPRACPHPRPCPSVDFLRHGLLFVIPRTLTTSSILRNDCHISSRPSLCPLPSPPPLTPTSSPSVPPASSLVHRSTASTALTHFFLPFVFPPRGAGPATLRVVAARLLLATNCSLAAAVTVAVACPHVSGVSSCVKFNHVALRPMLRASLPSSNKS